MMKHGVVLALAIVPGLTLAAAPAVPSRATIRVTGHAQVSKTPDRVFIDVGVTTKSPKPKDAVARNAARVSSVLAALRKAAGPGAQVVTSSYTVNPYYHYHSDGTPPTLVGYTAIHMLQVRLDDIGRIGTVVDAATDAGANRLQDLRFTLRSKEAARDEALGEAAVTARQDARALARALGLRIVRIVSVEESQPVIVPFARLQAAGMRFAQPKVPTPIQTGPIKVAASVTLTVAVAPRGR